MATITAPVIYPTPTPTPRKSQAEQSRLNGAKSRGPVTEEGKTRSSQNARKHGLTAKHSLVDPEDASEYLQHHNSMIADLKPEGTVEEMLADQVVKGAWKLRQAHNIEMDLMKDNLECGDEIHSAFTQQELSMIRLSRYQTAIERSMYRALSELRKRQAANNQTPRQRSPQSEKFKTNPEVESTSQQNEPGHSSLEMIHAEMSRRGMRPAEPSACPDAADTEGQPAAEQHQARNFKTNPDREPDRHPNEPECEAHGATIDLEDSCLRERSFSR